MKVFPGGRAIAAILFLTFVWTTAQLIPPANAQSLEALQRKLIEHHQAGRYGAAARVGKRALRLCSKRFGRNHPRCIDPLNNLAVVYSTQSRFKDALPLYERSLSIMERVFGKSHRNIARALQNVALVYQEQARYEDSIRLYRRAIAIKEREVGKSHPSVALTLGNLAIVYQKQAKYTEAIALYERVLEIQDRASGVSKAELSRTLNNLASVYEHQSRYSDALPLFRRALEIGEGLLGKSHPFISLPLDNLAGVYVSLGQNGEAVPLYIRALKIREKAFGKSHPDVAATLNNLAGALAAQGRTRDAVPLYERALFIREKRLGKNHPEVAVTLDNLADLKSKQTRLGQAARYYTRSLAIKERGLGNEHPALAVTLNNLALVRLSQGNPAPAVQNARRAAAIQAGRVAASVETTLAGSGTDGGSVFAFSTFVRSAHALSLVRKKERPKLSDEAFKAAQLNNASSAGRALQRMATRSGAGDVRLSRLVRKQQDMIGELQKIDAALISALSTPRGKRKPRAEKKLRRQRQKARSAIAAIGDELAQKYPAYVSLSKPAPLSLAGARKWLSPEEALVKLLVLSDETFIWAVTREGAAWHKIEQTAESLREQISEIRQTLDPISALKPDNRGFERVEVCRGLAKTEPCPAYDTDLDRAHRLYEMLLGPVDGLIRDKKHLIIVPSGPLTALPFQTLLTDAAPGIGSLAERFKQAPWLIRRQAVSILPSVSSLHALRGVRKSSPAKLAFIGFGNPDFSRPGKAKAGTGQIVARGVSSYFKGRQADLQALSNGLVQLPDTADELRAIGKLLGAREDEIILRRRASEDTVKHLSGSGDLADYRVVHFATHGLVAGEVKGLAEPALALSLPSRASGNDDGLLTASEVAGLKLNAEWVLLSACNTAAGGRPGAEALSGLAKSFFYSGARSLMVSHWPVVSSAAVSLTTGAFEAQASDPAVSRAEALRRSMLALIEGDDPHKRHPAYWGPFFIVGEGGSGKP